MSQAVASIWTLETLAAHFNNRLDIAERYSADLSQARESRTDERFAASKEATTLAFDAAKEATQIAMSASDKAIAKAEAAADKRAEASNGIRDAMADQQKNFADKVQTDFRLGAIEKRLDGTEGRSKGIGMSAAVVFQVLTMIISVSAIGLVLLRHA